MAFGNGSRQFGPNSVFYSFKICTKDLPAPVFAVSKKGADGQYHPVMIKDEKTGEQVQQTVKNVSGNLVSASPKENTHENKLIRSVNLTIQGNGKEDKDDVYFVSVGETFLGRNLYNGLLGLKTFADIEIGLYQSRPRPAKPGQPAQTKTFASVALRQHGEPVRGPYDQKKDMPLVKKVRVNGKDQSDTEELDNWFREKMIAWCKLVNAASKNNTSAPAAQTDTSAHTDTPEGEDVDGDATGHEPDGEAPF